MINISKDLTIILVLKDRAQFTWRWMEYYNKVGLPFKVIIADGGKDPAVEKLKDTSLFPNIEYKYIRYPYDKDIPTFLNKLNSVMSLVDTPYTLLTDNDDFFFNEGLEKAVKFLDDHHDYFAARGEIYNFLIRPTNSVHDRDKDVYGQITGFEKVLIAPSNTEATVLGRVKIFSEYSTDLAHDVCRTSGVKKTCEILANSEITDLQLSDNLMDYLLVTFGKVHRGEGLFMLHQSHVGGLGHALLKADPFQWMLSEPWPEDFSKMCKLIATEISKGDKIPFEYAYNRVVQHYTCFLIGKNMIKNQIERRVRQMPPKIVAWGRIFNKNNIIRKFFKKLYLKIKDHTQKIRSDKMIESSPYREEVGLVINFLAKNSHAK